MEMNKQEVFDLFKTFENKPFWEEKACNFTLALQECLEINGYPLDDDEFEESDRTKVVENGIEVVYETITIKFLGMVFHLYAKKNQNNHWEYFVNELKQLTSTISADQIININGVDAVLVVYNCGWSGTKVYAVPVEVAENIGLNAFNEIELHNGNEHRVIDLIDEYELSYSVSFSNYD